MPVSHARVTAVTSTDDELPGLLEVLARVPDPRKRRGRRYTLVFMLAVAVACVLAAKNFREAGDQAADLPQEVLARLGGRPHPLLRKIIAREPDHVEIDYRHGRIIKRSLWITGAADVDFPHVTRAVRIRRDGYDAAGTLISKEIVHAVTSLGEDRAGPADLAKIARGQRGIESVHWVRDTAYREDSGAGYSGSWPQAMATCRNITISLLYLAGVTAINRTLQAIGRDRTRMLSYLPL